MSYFNYHNKNIFYQEIGSGTPLIFLHGNTASSKMFEMLLPLYQENFRVIFIDFLGNGQSDRIENFPQELWYEEALQTIALIEHLGYAQVNLIGTSGGAWAAVNAALERPELVNKVVADSFDGRTLHNGFAKDLLAERNAAKKDVQAKQFYEWCQGANWEAVVDADTRSLLQFATLKKPLFHKPLSSLQMPILFMGSREDTMVRKDLADEYRKMADIVRNGAVYLFDAGSHPAILSNAEAASQVIQQFINR
jgi:pimeloyl-ACP methyl ester carboxylesterase